MADLRGKIAVAVAFASLGAACTSRTRPDADGSPGTRGVKTRFVCAGDRCVQRYPRLPDDGEWTCHDMAGAAVCSGGDPPAGVPFNLSDPAWICGPRRTTIAARAEGERVCVNLAPDFPDGAAHGWRCHDGADNGVTRVCERDATAHVIGDACDVRAPCLDGLHCMAGRCTPEPPNPSCILDVDCDEGVCRLGSCWQGPT